MADVQVVPAPNSTVVVTPPSSAGTIVAIGLIGILSVGAYWYIYKGHKFPFSKY